MKEQFVCLFPLYVSIMHHHAGEEAFSCIHCQAVTSDPNFCLHVKSVIMGVYVIVTTECTALGGLRWLINYF